MRNLLLSKSLLIIRFSPFLLLFALVFSACKKEDVPEDDLFELGQTVRYAIEGTKNFTVSDNFTNCEFVFPDGGTGELIVSEIMEGLDFEGIPISNFKVDIEGSGVVELHIPINDKHVQAYVYGPITGASVKPNIGENSWSAMLEQDTLEGKLRFELNLGDLGPALKTSTGRYAPPKSSYFAVSSMKKEGDYWNKIVGFHKTIEEVSDLWMSLLPVEEHHRLLQLRSGDLKYDVRLSGSNYYQHFDNYVWKNAVFGLKPTATLAAIAHETGHYMNHMMSGYEQYSKIQDAMPKRYYVLGPINHIFGMFIAGRLYLLEEYAHFSEFLATGVVEHHDMYNVANVNYFSQAMDEGDPEKNDYPSREGFGTGILAGLMRTESQMHYFKFRDNTKVPVPVFNIGLGKIIYYLLAPGPVTINDLYANVYAYLGSLGDEEVKKLPAFLEPLGWSYFGKGKLVDEEGKPLKDFAVRSVVIADKEYYGPLSEPSNEKGEFEVKRMPPGDTFLRVYANLKYGEYTDSTDIEQFISYKSLTNEELELGEKVVEFKEKLERITLSKVFDTRKYEPPSTMTGPIITTQLDYTGQFVQSEKNDYNFDASFLDRSDVSSLISLRIYCKSDLPITGSLNYKWTMSNYNWTWEYVDQEYYKSLKFVLSSDCQPYEEDYQEGPYAPMFTWSKNGDMVSVELNIDPKVAFASTNTRRYRLNGRFSGETQRLDAYGNKRTSPNAEVPSSVIFSIHKQY